MQEGKKPHNTTKKPKIKPPQMNYTVPTTKKAEPANLLVSCGMNPDTCLNSSSLALTQSLQAAQSQHRQAGVSWLYPTY